MDVRDVKRPRRCKTGAGVQIFKGIIFFKPRTLKKNNTSLLPVGFFQLQRMCARASVTMINVIKTSTDLGWIFPY